MNSNNSNLPFLILIHHHYINYFTSINTIIHCIHHLIPNILLIDHLIPSNP